MSENRDQINRLEKKFAHPLKRRIKTIFVKGLYLFIKTLTFFMYRFFELFFALPVVVFLLLPVWIFLALYSAISRKPLFLEETIWGKKAIPFRIVKFTTGNFFIDSLPLFLFVITGQLGITGISIRRYADEKIVLGDAYLFNTKPGIYNLWYVRSSSKMSTGDRRSVENEYILKRSIDRDVFLIIKNLIASLYHDENKAVSDTVTIFDIRFQNITMKRAVGIIDSVIREKLKKSVFFVNPDCLNKIFSDQEYASLLEQNELTFPDGIGINIACRMLHTPLKENINGTDMFPEICKLALDQGYSFYLLGAKPGVAEKMKIKLTEKYPGLKISGSHDGYFDRETGSEQIIKLINDSGADILLVAFGAPNQEKWIAKWSGRLNPAVKLGVGGLFDFYSDTIKRAPLWMREIGFEWVFRILQEPKRMWQRYIIGNPLFIARVLRWKYIVESREKMK